ncbi:sensor domain-containing diguanylate cyclase [Sulfurovum sp. zt1-1]|uniref:diguanylate cyclase n=1 Tax=Sulfurovum zhangzhouensis TaxID=3019067 RepID=A0ABT7QUV7_9BACT|nr:sensor domain-containing diguanylate cyclase [Sulfurovum zhangzhouensis]MDM5270632.1 sensor domain-containing diguanylate cyclase [Sulfurovum zhangzhouensis]
MEEELALCYQILDASDEQIAVIDTKYHYIFANEAYLSAHQKHREEIKNTHLQDTIGADTFNNKLKQQLNDCYIGKEVSYEGWIKFQEKGFKFMRVRYTALRNTQNQVKAISISYRDLTEQKQCEVSLSESKQIIEQISITDWVTELHSKIYFDEVFPKVINISKRNDQILSFGLINIDNFKEYNETHGGNAGDEALKKIAKSLKNSFKRPNDYTFRLDKDTFAMLFNVTKYKDVEYLCEKIRQCIESLRIEHSNSSEMLGLTVSMGVSILKPDQNESADMIYRNTQQLLKHAKKEGKNKIYYSQS